MGFGVYKELEELKKEIEKLKKEITWLEAVKQPKKGVVENFYDKDGLYIIE